MSLLLMACKLGQQVSTGKPMTLQCDALNEPLGVDSKRPALSWKLQDNRIGARQTAYRIWVATNLALLQKGKSDVWDSQRVDSDSSIDVPYGGPPLMPQTRYYWQIQVWDKDGKPYPLSDVSWWETGLGEAANWRAQWIGYEEAAQRRLREAAPIWITNAAQPDYKGNTDTRHDFRLAFDFPKPVKTAWLYTTGEDTFAAWINGEQVLKAQPLPRWGRSPWRTYTRKDVSRALLAGKNLLAIEVRLHKKKNRSQAPMSAALYAEMTDGSIELLKTGDLKWKAQFNAKGDWQRMSYDDSAWASAEHYMRDNLRSPLPTAPVVALRRKFEITKPYVSARLYATSLGAYKFSLNGKPVGDQFLSPGWTDYRQRVTYQAFDVTSLIRRGQNAIGAYLAPGWYSTPLEWVGQGNNYGESPDALKAQLKIEYANGAMEWILTDESWRADVSPITFAEIYDGETYDARREQLGWDTASFSDQSWHAVSVIHPQEPAIVWQSFQPIRDTEVLQAKEVRNPASGIFIYDFGQNLAGVARVRFQGEPGREVRLRFGEVLNPDGTLYVENLRNAKATDHYVSAGNGVDEYQPSFTFHGFRYVELSGVPGDPGRDAVRAIVAHTDAPISMQFKTGSPMVNQLWHNILWGQRSNFVGVPTDCPQRDERLGWAGDAQVFWRTATFNMDLTAFSRKYAADLRGTQIGTAMYGIYAPGVEKPNPGYATGWSDAGVIVPWTSWIQNGDRSILEQNWDSMEKYLGAILEANPNHLWKNKSGNNYGDWLAPEGKTPLELIATAYWAHDATLMKQIARALGRTNDERRYADLFTEIKAAFNRAYVTSDGIVLAAPSPGATRDLCVLTETQTGYVLALKMNLLPDSMRSLAAKRLADRIATDGWKLATGFLGTPYLLGVLADTGYADVAYQLLLNTDYPSWGYMVEHGATTMWERWNGDQMLHDPSMNSYNHYAYGAVAEWLYRYAAGVDTLPGDPGFHTILLHPNFDARLGSLDFSYESRYGTIKSAWTATGDNFLWKVTIPPNAKARLRLTEAEAGAYTIEDKSIAQSSAAHFVSKQGEKNVYELAAGSYQFKVTH